MHRIYFPIDRDSDVVELTGEAHHYLSRVVRLAPGDRVALFDESGWERLGRIESVDRKTAQIRIEEKRPNRCEPGRAVWLVQGFPKGSKWFEIIRAATALGASGFIPFVAKRSVGGRGGKTRAWHDRCAKVVLEASRQCGRARVPEVTEPASSLSEALERFSASRLLGVCFWEEATEPLADVLDRENFSSRRDEPLVVVIGPEGGLTREEAEEASRRGLALCSLGPRILRTELAPIAALSILQYRLGEME